MATKTPSKAVLKILKSSEEVRIAVREELGLLAIDVYRDLMVHGEDKVRKLAADAVMELSVDKEVAPVQGIAFNFPTDALKSAITGLKKVAAAPQLTVKDVNDA